MLIRLFPNFLTSLRILLTPVVIFLLLCSGNHTLLAAVVFFIASLTDYFDGRVARKYGLISKSGIFLDPVADKILVLSTFFSFYLLRLIPLWMVIIIGLRELVLTGLRLFLLKHGHTLAASPLGKWKTVLQLGAIAFLFSVLLAYEKGIIVRPFYVFMVMIPVLLFTCYSGIDYFIKNRKKLSLLMKGFRQ